MSYKKINNKAIKSLLFLATFIATTLPSFADDMELYSILQSQSIAPNLLFVLDNSKSMNKKIGRHRKSRYSVMLNALSQTMSSIDTKANIGVISLSGPFTGSGIAFPVAPLSSSVEDVISSNSSHLLPKPKVGETVQSYIPKIPKSWEMYYGTPHVDALVEAHQYFSGKAPKNGWYPPINKYAHKAAHPNSYTGKINSDGTGDARYISPITHACQRNYIVFMTDGNPAYRNGAQTKSKNYIQKYLAQKTCRKKPYGYIGGTCGPEMSDFLSRKDQAPHLPGTQTVDIFTIGFGLDRTKAVNFLKRLTSIKNGFYSANSADQLQGAFSSILKRVDIPVASFKAPTLALNTNNRLQSSDQIFIPLFELQSDSTWRGNLKKFKLRDGEIVDAHNKAAFDNLGKLQGDIQDLWAKNKGSGLAHGGAAGLLNPKERKLWTHISGNQLTRLSEAGNAIIPLHLLTDEWKSFPTRVDPDNSKKAIVIDCKGDEAKLSISKATIGETQACKAPTITQKQRTAYLKYIHGYDSQGGSRRFMGDIAHSKPTLFFDESTKEQILFVGSNEGFLHAFDTDSGKELWAFMPRSLLKTIGLRYNRRTTPHIYGVDGEVTIWQDKENKKTYLYVGLRRGGHEYYALDITNPKAPKLAWHLNNQSSHMSSLGQTWSKPIATKIKLKSGTNFAARDVLIFGGGYDPKLDFIENNEPVSMGNDVFIVDAHTGEHILSLSNKIVSSGASMGAIPSNVRIIDHNNDGAVDRLYFADTKGQLWRADFPADSEPQVHLLATLNQASSSSGSDIERTFFYSPDVSAQNHQGQRRYMISLGSGRRSNILNTSVHNRMYTIIDPHPNDWIPKNFKPLQEDKHIVAVDKLEGQKVLDTDYQGWYLDLPHTGEKVLAPSVTFRNMLIFTTFVPNDKSSNVTDSNTKSCNLFDTAAYAYVVDINTGKAVADLAKDGVATKERSVLVGKNEIMDTPWLLFGESKCGQSSDCSQPFEIRVGKNKEPLLTSSSFGSNHPINAENINQPIKVFWRNMSNEH